MKRSVASGLMNLFKKKKKPSKEAQISKQRKGMLHSGNAKTFSATEIAPESISAGDQSYELGTRGKSVSSLREYQQVYLTDSMHGEGKNPTLDYDQIVKRDYISTMIEQKH